MAIINSNRRSVIRDGRLDGEASSPDVVVVEV